VLGIELFVPTPGPFAARIAILAGAALVLCVVLAVTETTFAKMRILRVPLFLTGGGALCLIGLASWLGRGGA
jgi:formate hydrogenlyase subunit 4